VGDIIGIIPSGIVPDGDAGAHVWRSSALCGEDEDKGPDCYIFNIFEGLLAKCEGQFVIPFLLWVLSIIVSSPLK
jgi:hypothetical protein